MTSAPPTTTPAATDFSGAKSKPKIALWFRYGPAEHAELFHAIPRIVTTLARTCEVHYFGLRSRKPLPEEIARQAVVHTLPFTVDRTSQRDKFLKTALWVLSLPWIGLYCRRRGVRAVYLDETVPLTAWLARLFFGRHVVLTVADFFTDIYLDRHPFWRPIGRALRALDLASWRRLPLIFTRVHATRAYLAERGIAPERVCPVYDPCDLAVYRPLDRAAMRPALGLAPDALVLVHHGILHPNKGNDFILRALAEMKDAWPTLHYLLIGDGPDMPRLKTLTRELGLEDRVRFTGWLATLEEVNRALNAGDIGLVMRVGQTADNFHVTGALVHSLACGLPVLAARLAGIAEVVREDVEGCLFDPRDRREFQAQLIRLLQDPARRARLGRAALARARDLFDMERVTRATCEPLLRLVEDGSAEPRPPGDDVNRGFCCSPSAQPPGPVRGPEELCSGAGLTSPRPEEETQTCAMLNSDS